MIEPVSLLIGALAGAAAVLIAWLWTRQQTAGRLARLESERDAALRLAGEQRELTQAARGDTRDTFAALSREALRDNRDDFLQTADALLAPVREVLGRVQTHLTDVDKAREGTFQSVSAQLRSLRRSSCARPPKACRARCARRMSAASGAKFSCAASSNWPACCITATSSRRPRRRRPMEPGEPPTSLSGFRAAPASSSMRRSRSTRTSRPRRPRPILNAFSI